MSKHTIDGNVKLMNMSDILEIIREEQITPTESHTFAETVLPEQPCHDEICHCICKKEIETKDRITPEDVENILKERETKLREEYEKRLERELVLAKDRFDFILSNEQMRASYMLREAHRERQEKITALQTQLECKNLTGLMYVMCAERRRSKLERLRLTEEYTSYIHALQDILAEGQALILHLSRGYKTAARVDNEWREKMKKIVSEFMMFIYDYAGGTPESNQYFFDLPQLLKTEAPVTDDPKEDPCEEVEGEHDDIVAEDNQGDKMWWETLEGDCRPFVMFGDMGEFRPDRRREVLKTVKAAKTAPKKWKEYVFNEMFLKSECSNSGSIKDVYPTKLPNNSKWECSEAVPQDRGGFKTPRDGRDEYDPAQRVAAQSVDIRGNMGSLLKIITSTNTAQQAPKTTLLGARDSMEIQSTTRLREKHVKPSGRGEIVINIGKRRTSFFTEDQEEEDAQETMSTTGHKVEEEDVSPESLSPLGWRGPLARHRRPLGVAIALSTHNDSLQMIPAHVPDKDRINYEKVCPMEKCQRMQVDSFTRALPPYMRANPYTHFEQPYEGYETCTPEQLEILKQRIEAKRSKETSGVLDESPLLEWTPSVQGVMTQTSELSLELPPCTCTLPAPEEKPLGMVFNMDNLIPMKQALETIRKACFFDENIEFNRFKVIGQQRITDHAKVLPKTDFRQRRYQEIRKILKQHPSLLDIFQANTRC